MQMSSLGKGESVNSCLAATGSPFQCKFLQFRGRQKFSCISWVLIILTQNNLYAEVAHQVQPALGPLHFSSSSSKFL